MGVIIFIIVLVATLIVIDLAAVGSGADSRDLGLGEQSR